jgi:acetoin utilization deacetylase AcuC-like enzyme
LFYASSHEKDNFPGTGKDPTPYIGDQARSELDRRIVNRYLYSGPGSRSEFYDKWEREILPEMERFQPDAIIISAGKIIIV